VADESAPGRVPLRAEVVDALERSRGETGSDGAESPCRRSEWSRLIAYTAFEFGPIERHGLGAARSSRESGVSFKR
jgi:hypothetical protein